MRNILAVIIIPIIGAFALPSNAFALTEAEANKAYQQAVEKYKQKAVQAKTKAVVEKKAAEIPPVINIVDDDTSIPNHTDPNYNAGKTATEVNLADFKLAVDLENMPLQDVVEHVIKKVETKAGNFEVKWRLKQENRDIKTEKVNLVAEATFGEFINFLTERIKNMTGIQLFVTVFERSRIIMISDTYY